MPEPTGVPVAAPVPLARLGTFHVTMGAAVAGLLEQRRIRHATEPVDRGTRVLVDAGWRDEVRAELTLAWGDLVRALPEDQVLEVLASGGSAPGWYDAPRGGHVDRTGRLVVEAGEEEEAATDAARIAGPALLTVGAILAVTGWYVFDSSAVLLAGIALLVLGVLSPK
ncbi:hypothetical protein [Egicoccus halophilus]|uniref:hypothetical protein n=1 Tax=Egicoccus halophilus TaxID=1670830 RepID=UPI00103077DC|nr:hypothetical protein [Egicoccus halophilus]